MKTNSALIILLFAAFQLTYAQKTIDLFNGKNLDGWVNHGEEKWYVENGELICESGPKAGYGYLSTKDFYDNFQLTLEFKQENNGNSGVFIRSTVEGTKVSGWQVEVAPPGHATGGIYESYGRGWLIKPDAEKDKALKMGEWNTMKILVRGPIVSTWLNDQKMVHLVDAKIGQGKGGIALQIHDGGGIRVKWRNIKLTPLIPE
ncbi:3-keto-disaccharide hydrolase [Flagellimonas sp. 2504JD4-2]